MFGIEVEEEDVETIGGFVFSRHGTVPDPGTRVDDDAAGLHFTVDEMDGRRIISVTVRHSEPKEEPAKDPD
jgi:CBS domain containing-hemolysin-like protein